MMATSFALQKTVLARGAQGSAAHRLKAGAQNTDQHLAAAAAVATVRLAVAPAEPAAHRQSAAADTRWQSNARLMSGRVGQNGVGCTLELAAHRQSTAPNKLRE